MIREFMMQHPWPTVALVLLVLWNLRRLVVDGIYAARSVPEDERY